MRDKHNPRLHVLTLLTILILVPGGGTPSTVQGHVRSGEVMPQDLETLLAQARDTIYRVRVSLKQPRSLSQIEAWGAIVLQVADDSALAVVTGWQLEELAKQRFEPHDIGPVAELLRFSDSSPSVTEEQVSQLIAAPTADSDNDGLTDQEEMWWATDPNNPDTDWDTHTDGDEVASILAGDPVQGPPFLKWQEPDGSPLLDGDVDCVPDMAETFVVGSNPDRESTDGDKFDDGQELFGITKYPGYGALPRPEDTFITANMPGWVDPPGDSIFVAAYPQISVQVASSSIQVQLATTVTTGESHQVGESVTYGVATTQGTSTSVGKTESHSYNTWQEVTNSSADQWERSHYVGTTQSESYQYSKGYTQGWHVEGELGGYAEVTAGVQATVKCLNLAVCVGAAAATGGGGALAAVGADVGAHVEGTVGASWALSGGIERQNSESQSWGVEVSREEGDTYSYARILEQSHTRGAGQEVGYASTIERSSYEEATVSNDHTIATSEEWSTATAVDTQHAADLFFTYQVSNSGTDNAREISGIVFNVYIGPTMRTYYASQQDIGVLENFYPGESHVYSSSAIPLSLEQLRMVDEGAPIHVVVEDYSYGDDEQFYQNAWAQSVLVEVDDGVEDGLAEVDPYMIATWGDESYQQVIGRYFSLSEHYNGNLVEIVTPEYNPHHEIVAMNSHRVASNSWWDILFEDKSSVFLLGEQEEETTSFKDEEAWPETRLLLRFNEDTDRDHYSDRTELEAGTEPDNPFSHPGPRLVAGYRKQRDGDQVTVTMSFLNLGNETASGIEAVMYAPDDTVSIGNNLIGGGGRVGAGQRVILGPTFGQPVLLPDNWRGDAQPFLAGLYTGNTERSLSFSVNDSGQVGISPSLTVSWDDGQGQNGTLDIGDNYSPPTRLDLIEGVQIAFSSGSVQADDTFIGTIDLPLDTMTYTINAEPYTEPVIVVSYNDAQGNHRFVTPVELSSLNADLAPHADSMLYEAALEIHALRPFKAEGENITEYIYNHPAAEAVSDAHLYLGMATFSGTMVAENITTTTTIAHDTNSYLFQWNTDVFTVPFQIDEQYKMVAALADWEGNIIDTDLVTFDDFDTSLVKRVFNHAVAASGGPASSERFQLNGTSGQWWDPGVRSSPNYRLWSGYWSGWVAPPHLPPDVPSNPTPSHGASDVPTDQVLTWEGGSPHDTPVTYLIALGTTNPPPVIAASVDASFRPTLASNMIYYWSITADDGILKTTGPVWQFSTGTTTPHLPPYVPSNPTPSHGAIDVPTDQVLTWEGGSPHDIPVTYLIALGTTNPPPFIADSSETSFHPSLASNKTYYWSITADDGALMTVGPVWQFSTGTQMDFVYLPLILK